MRYDDSNQQEQQYNAILATYGKNPDATAQWLAQAGIPKSLWAILPKDVQGEFTQASKGIAANPHGVAIEAPDAMTALINSGVLSDVQAQAYMTDPTGKSVKPGGTKIDNSLVAQPKDTSKTGSGGGFAGPSYTPQLKSGQLTDFLKTQGYSFPFDTTKFVKDAIKNSNGDMSLAQNIFMGELIKSPQFKAYYPNIFDKSGRMIVSIQDYDNNVQSYQKLAQRQGFTVSRKQAGQLISDEVSPDEFNHRTQQAKTIANNKDLFLAFNDVLKAKGLKGVSNAKDAFDFLQGKASPAQYQAWNAATAEAAAKKAGLQETAKGALGATAPATGALNIEDVEKAYTDIAQQLRDSGAELTAYGLTQRDLETIQFGGSNRAILAARAQQAVAQQQAQGQQVGGEQLALQGNKVALADQQKAGA